MKILTIGNSFADSVFDFMPPIAASFKDCRLTLERANIGGCSLKRHWEEYLHSMEDETYKPYYQEFSLKEKLTAEKWDVVTIQQASYESWKADSYEPYAGNIIALIKEYAPEAETVIQQTWSYNACDPRLTSGNEKSWGFGQKEMFEKLEKCYRDLAEKYSLRVIPTGLAVQYSRELIKDGDVVGNIADDNKGKDFIPDLIHFNVRGKYMQACLCFAFFFKRKFSEIDFIPETVSKEDASMLIKAAEMALNDYRQLI